MEFSNGIIMPDGVTVSPASFDLASVKSSIEVMVQRFFIVTEDKKAVDGKFASCPRHLSS